MRREVRLTTQRLGGARARRGLAFGRENSYLCPKPKTSLGTRLQNNQVNAAGALRDICLPGGWVGVSQLVARARQKRVLRRRDVAFSEHLGAYGQSAHRKFARLRAESKHLRLDSALRLGGNPPHKDESLLESKPPDSRILDMQGVDYPRSRQAHLGACEGHISRRQGYLRSISCRSICWLRDGYSKRIKGPGISQRVRKLPLWMVRDKQLWHPRDPETTKQSCSWFRAGACRVSLWPGWSFSGVFNGGSYGAPDRSRSINALIRRWDRGGYIAVQICCACEFACVFMCTRAHAF